MLNRFIFTIIAFMLLAVLLKSLVKTSWRFARSF